MNARVQLRRRTSTMPNLLTGLFHGEYGSQGIAMHSAVSATAATKSSATRSRGSQEWCRVLHLRQIMNSEL